LSSAQPAAAGWALDKQILQWVVPYHEGAVAYFKEIGKWGGAEQAHNDELINRQDLLALAWEAMDKDLEGETFKVRWMEIRAGYLERGGHDPIWR
jgi:hypothetical protein